MNYIVNSNLCGYLPASDGIECETAEEALEALRATVQAAADAATLDAADRFDEALVEVSLLTPADVANGCAIIIGDECFFIASPFYPPATRVARIT